MTKMKAAPRRLLCIIVGIVTMLTVITTVTVTATTTTTQLLGIPKKLLSHYQQPQFTCLDQSATFPSSVINDDYCDCKDGSDEPGTSACINSQFFCLNKGAVKQYLTSSKVNDGICDCCDGTDEWKQVVNCPDQCEKLGEQLYQSLLVDIALARKGLMAHDTLVEQSKSLKTEKETRRTTLQNELAELERRLSEAREKVNVEEAKENEERTKRVAEQAGQQQQQVDEQPVASQDEKSTTTTAEPESLNQQVETEIEAFPYPKEYAYPQPTATEVEKKAEGEENFPYPEEYMYKADDADLIPPPEDVNAGVSNPGSDNKQDENTEQKHPSDYVSEDAQKARNELNDLQNSLNSANTQIEEIGKFLSTNFGEDSAFATLFHQCYSVVIKQYTYEVCLYNNAHQIEGAGRTSLGSFTAIGRNLDKLEKQDSGEDSKESNEESKQESKLPETTTGTDNLQMKFTGGQMCWQGPARSLLVTFHCGPETQIISVDEPSKCVYTMVMRTPAVCTNEYIAALTSDLEARRGAVDEE